jgi:hydroxyethylthiazole kinase-like sugar kinase family protein
MKRRSFIQTAGGAALASLTGAGCMTRSVTATELESLFVSDRPELLVLAKRVMQKCGCFKHTGFLNALRRIVYPNAKAFGYG